MARRPRRPGATLSGVTLGVLCWLVSGPSAAALPDQYWDRAKEGWFWYEEPPPPAPVEPTPPTKPAPPPARPVPPAPDPDERAVRERLKTVPVTPELLATLPARWLRALTEAKLERAMDDPAYEAVAEYILVQRENYRRSNEFTRFWQLVLYTQPDLDGASEQPSALAGLTIADALKAERDHATLAAAANDAGLYFFFTSTCPFCQKMAPIVKLFADTYGWAVLPVTLDGRPLPEFPDAKPDNGMSEALGVRGVPAVFLSIPKDRFLVPVGQGFLTMSDLEQRILLILERRSRIPAQVTKTGAPAPAAAAPEQADF